MKKLTFTLCLLLLVKLLMAQDIIVKKDGTRIKSKILKVTITGITYKNFNDLEGPTLTLRSKEISSYSYENEITSNDSNTGYYNEGNNPDDKKMSDTLGKSSQDKPQLQDVVYLKNGSIIKGVITEQIPDVSIKIETSDGSIFVFKADEIEKIDKSKLPVVKSEVVQTTVKKPVVDVNDYGSHFSMEASIGGGGIAGVSVRVFLHRNIPFEIGVHLHPILFIQTVNNNGKSTITDWQLYPDVLVSGEFNFFLSRKYVPNKRVRLSGIFVKGGYAFGSRYDGTMGAIGWQYERFKIFETNNSFSFGLGAGLMVLDDKEARNHFTTTGQSLESTIEYSYQPMIYWRVAWNFFIRTKKQVKS